MNFWMLHSQSLTVALENDIDDHNCPSNRHGGARSQPRVRHCGGNFGGTPQHSLRPKKTLLATKYILSSCNAWTCIHR